MDPRLLANTPPPTHGSPALRRPQSGQPVLTLNPYERLPFFWENKTKLKRIKISAYDGVDFWGYSGNLTIEKSTDTIVLRK